MHARTHTHTHIRTSQPQPPRARVVVDGVAYAPHLLVDVGAWGVDWYAFSIYK
jgi:selenocysteine lyase/cysteine desulfurase